MKLGTLPSPVIARLVYINLPRLVGQIKSKMGNGIILVRTSQWTVSNNIDILMAVNCGLGLKRAMAGEAL